LTKALNLAQCPLWRLLISSRSVSKHGHHMQFLFLIGRFLKNLLLWNFLAKWTKTWHSIDASYQVSVHLAKRFQWRRFLKIGQSETRIACGGHVC
jgi:hypothetical protein